MTAAFAEQLSLRGHTLRNRLVATAHSTGLAHDGLAVEGDAEYWRRLADGGVAMAIPGGTVVAPESTYRGRTRTEAYRRESIPGLRLRAAAIKAGGAVAISQLLHVGRETTGSPLWLAPVGPSAVRSPREPTAPHALTQDEVRGLVRSFREAAANVREAGFDGFELHAAHGYLLAQFLSADTNRRTDRYGGDLDGRMRVLVEIVEAIRELDPAAILGVRLSDEEAWSDMKPPALAAVLENLAELAPIDYVNVTVGVRGNYVRDMAMEEPPILPSLAELRRAAGVPLLACQGFRTSVEIEHALAAGADLVGMARPLLADPDLPLKFLAGRERAVRPCVGCNEDCRAFTPRVFCSVNPELAPHGEPRRPAEALVVSPGPGGAQRAIVVGAGPAGLECALALARAGITVTIVDQRPALGGELAVAAAAPHRKGWERLLRFYQAELEETGVELRLGSPAVPTDLEATDAVVLATGSEEVLPSLPGAGHARTSSAAIAAGVEALRGVDRLLVVDDGFGWWPGVSVVELALAAGVGRITMLTPSGSFAGGIPAESRFQLMERLAGAPLETVSFLVPEAIDGDSILVRHRFTGERSRIDGDAVVVVGERIARGLPFDPPVGRLVLAIGDAVVPRRVAHALAEARAAAEAIVQVQHFQI